jgi:hypothetical protein
MEKKKKPRNNRIARRDLEYTWVIWVELEADMDDSMAAYVIDYHGSIRVRI